MKSPWPLLAIAVAAGLLVWLLMGGGADGEDAENAGDAPSTTTLPDGAMRADAPELENRPSRGPRKRPGHSPFKPFKERTGTLEILPIDPDGLPISADLCTVSLERVNPPERMGKLGLRDRETGVWTFNKVPIGQMRVIVHGDHLVETREVVRVREAVTTYKKVSVELGAMIRYRATLPDGTEPKKVHLELINRQGRQSVVYWQTRQPRLYTSARRAKKVHAFPQGVVFGIRPGRYELRAKTDDEHEDRLEIVVAAGDTEDVVLELRR